MDFEAKDLGTVLQHFGEPKKTGDPVVPPITQTSLFVFDTVDELWGLQQENVFGPPFHYSRIGNPTLDIVEKKLAKLEGTERGKVYGAGMGAISSAIMSVVESGSHVVALDTCYGPTKQFLKDYLPRFGVNTTFVDGLSVESFLDAVTPETVLLYLESPGSIIFRLQEIRRITAFCRERGITTIIDNSYATPLYQQPTTMGVDIVVHSASKYLGGHSDITAGALCTSTARMERIVKEETALFGAALAPFPAWLMLRGMRTLQIRLKYNEASANEIAAWLKSHPDVERVNHVGDPDFPQRDLFLSQMQGSAGLFSFEPKNQDMDYVKRLIEALEVFQIGVSWGGFESLSVPIWMEPMDWSGPRWVIRLYCGLESPRDLIADLKQAFEAVR